MTNNQTGLRALALAALDKKWDSKRDSGGTAGHLDSVQKSTLGTAIADENQSHNATVPLFITPRDGTLGQFSDFGTVIGTLTGQSSTLPFGKTLTALERQCPAYVDEARWHQCVDDARRFLPEWGNQAEALGWTARDLFGLHTPPANPHPSYDRLSRYDETGMLWGLDGRRVVALSSNTAAVETGTDAITYRKLCKPALGPFGDTLDDFK